MLSTYALKLGQKHPLQKVADFLGMGLEEFIARFARERDERQTLRPGCLPRR